MTQYRTRACVAQTWGGAEVLRVAVEYMHGAAPSRHQAGGQV